MSILFAQRRRMLTSYRGNLYKIVRVLERRLLALASVNFFSAQLIVKQKLLWRWYRRLVVVEGVNAASVEIA